jgi:hypothetical protein
VAGWIGRLGMVRLPAVSVGLGLEERVVRRHVAKLEEAGWLRRDSWVRGEGSLLWLTKKGLDKAGLEELLAVRATRATWDMAQYGTRLGWAAAQLGCWGYRWRSRRELALEHDRWAIRVGSERSGRLPDLAAWPSDTVPPFAVVINRGWRRPEREMPILSAWRDAITAERYSAVHYETFAEASAAALTKLAHQAGHTADTFIAWRGATTADISRVPPPRLPPSPADEQAQDDVEGQLVVEAQPIVLPPPPATAEPPRAVPVRPTVLSEADRDRISGEALGIQEPKPRRRIWRR